ncbi:focadhesin [Octopus sinensis]|uniref:Focadhesin n=1 Tax=Octopus sinensis TaxID=2607531 RepID=A0A6P7SBZ4_9MOLL|nr:focadhesin [Octopus sinensis]
MQAALKLKTSILKKKNPGPLTSTSTETPELQQLWTACCDDSPYNCHTSCQVLLTLVYSKDADYSYVLNGLLNLIPSAKNLTPLISAIGDLLILQCHAQNKCSTKSYISPYSMRTPPHPFITVCTNRPESWPLLQQQIYQICVHQKDIISSNAVAILKPFLLYTILDPVRQDSMMPIRLAIQQILFQQAYLATSVDDDQYIGFLCSIVPHIQLDSSKSIGEGVQFVSQLLFIMLQQSTCPSLLRPLVQNAMALCYLCLQRDLSVMMLTHKILQIAHKWPEVLSTGQNIILLSLMLFEINADNTVVLDIALIILNTNNTAVHPVVHGCLILPLLYLMLSPQADPFTLHTIQTKSTSIIEAMEKIQLDYKVSASSETDSTAGMLPISWSEEPCMTEGAYQSRQYLKLCSDIVNESEINCLLLMNNIQESLTGINEIPVIMTNFLASLFVTPQCTNFSANAMNGLLVVAEKDDRQASFLLPLFLYQIGREPDPSRKLNILKAIPKLAQHKVVVGPILKSIQELGSYKGLKAIFITLLTELWKIQDRCFPQLQKALTEESITPGTIAAITNEVVFAKAHSITSICELRPVQHGPDMLSLLSDILNSCLLKSTTPAAIMALKGLTHLCEAEVINIQSLWKLLSTKLANDSRPGITIEICKLFALVPQLAVQNEEFEKFQEAVVSMLWLISQKFGDSSSKQNNPEVSAAAFRALAAFKVDNFTISHFPQQVTDDFRMQAEAVIKLEIEKNPDMTIENVFPIVPGVCYTRIIPTLKMQVQLDAYEEFLNSMVYSEVTNLPRGIYSSLNRKYGTGNQEKALDEIPTLLQHLYEQTKQPGLRPGLAAGLLFAYNLPAEQNKAPKPHKILSRSKNFQQMFSTLLHEVPVQPSEWHRCLLMPHTWVSFIDRLFVAMIEGRHAEIDLQLQHNQIQEDEVSAKKNSAWLWVRDTLTGVIKVTSRGNPTMQANCVMALSGVVCAVNKFRSGQDSSSLGEEESGSAHMKHKQWFMLVTDTLLSLWNVKYKTSGNNLLGLCQQRSQTDRAPASMLCQASACLALPRLVSSQLSPETCGRLFEVLSMMTLSLPGKSNQPESPVLIFHNGLALGILISRLFEEHFVEVCGPKNMEEVWKSLEALEECALNDSFPSRSGCILGLTLALTSLCEDGKPESRRHLAEILDKLFSLLKNTDSSSDIFQVLCFAVATCSGSVFSANIINADTINSIFDYLKNLSEAHPQMCGVSLAVGSLCYSLNMLGHASINKTTQTLCDSWTDCYLNEDTPTLERVSALGALMALIGSERSLINIQTIPSLCSNVVNPATIIQLVKTVLKSQEEVGIQCCSAWMLGHAYLANSTVSEVKSSVPTNYHYLDNKYIIRALVDFLLDQGKRGSETISNSAVKLALVALNKNIKRALPPLNWALLFSPYLRLTYSTEVKCLSLQVAISQSTTSSSASVFLATWLSSALFNSLPVEAQNIFYQNLDVLIKCIPLKTLKEFLEHECVNPFLFDQRQSQSSVTLNGLQKALMVNDPPESVTELLYTTVERIYKALTPHFQPNLYNMMCKCLANLPEDRFDQLTDDDFLDPQLYIKGTYVRCFLVANGKQPLALLNSCIDALINNGQNIPELYSFCLLFLSQCFYICSLNKTHIKNRLGWFLELIGHVRNLATGGLQLLNATMKSNIALDFAIQIVSAAICCWTSSIASTISGQHPAFMVDLVEKHQDGIKMQEISLSLKHQPNYWLQLLPTCVTCLTQEPWKAVLNMFIDWLLIMYELPDDKITPQTKRILNNCLCNLRNTKEFKRASVWNKVFKDLLEPTVKEQE